jgi:predicted site-specific integrase-resolvase
LLDASISQKVEKKLMEDLIALMTSFAGKMHRMRRGKNHHKAPTKIVK